MKTSKTASKAGFEGFEVEKVPSVVSFGVKMTLCCSNLQTMEQI